ncbi:DUF726 domain-containing protein [uncultured Paracoccus sp.]|uniref:DUF726 domain-containing protein n=1 Tax=uncultured Paracoccus sp. TaxID=189685 RepID=UPI0026203978|nr:DUF726 domain-containing protein [uncultured Paracoccus sp.]
MALHVVNAGENACPEAWAAAKRLPDRGPLVVMVHGYRFSPSDPDHDPHRHILSLTPAPGLRRAVSWPAELGFTQQGDEGLAIAYGWEARGHLRGAYARAAEAGAELALLIDRLAITSRRPVAVIGHSLGARVALSALARVAPGAIGRVVLLAGAEFRDCAEQVVSSPAGMLAEIINVTTRENDPYDFGIELLLRGGRVGTVGLGLSHRQDNWIDLQIDQPGVLDGLRALGFPVSAPGSRTCHWSPYLRTGMFDLYRAALCQPWSLPLPLLARHLPDRQARRWSRLFSLRASQSVSLGRA